MSTVWGNIIRERRNKLGINQDDLALQVGYQKEQKRNISNYEKGIRNPDLETLCRIANALSCTTDYLLGREQAPRHDAASVVQQTGLTAQAVAVLQSYEATVDNRTIQQFLSDLICSNELLWELSSYYKMWREKAREQTSEVNEISNAMSEIMKQDLSVEDKTGDLNKLISLWSNVPLNIEGLRYGIVRRFERFLTNMEQTVENTEKNVEEGSK